MRDRRHGNSFKVLGDADKIELTRRKERSKARKGKDANQQPRRRSERFPRGRLDLSEVPWTPSRGSLSTFMMLENAEKDLPHTACRHVSRHEVISAARTFGKTLLISERGGIREGCFLNKLMPDPLRPPWRYEYHATLTRRHPVGPSEKFHQRAGGLYRKVPRGSRGTRRRGGSETERVLLFAIVQVSSSWKAPSTNLGNSRRYQAAIRIIWQ